MSSIEKRTRNGRMRYYARYRDPSGRQVVKVFDRKVDAEKYLLTVEVAKLSGGYVDPRRSALPVGEWADQWLASQGHLKPDDEGPIRRHRQQADQARGGATSSSEMLPTWTSWPGSTPPSSRPPRSGTSTASSR